VLVGVALAQAGLLYLVVSAVTRRR
jgi:hypothetical protein